jgi:ABC-type Co2+ transport system permease subunit
MSEAEIAYLGVLTSAFFVASLIHLPAGPVKVHLLLNGLLGVVLRWRAAPAIAVGLLLQAILFQHGGISALGMNICVMTLPALLAWGFFIALNLLPCLDRPWFRVCLVSLTSCLWIFCLVYFAALIATNSILDLQTVDLAPANAFVFHPITLFLILLAGLQCAEIEPRLEHSPEFPLGLFIGVVTVLTTLLLHSLALRLAGAENWSSFILVNLIVHLPVAVIEGVILGFIVGFLAKVKPEMLGLRRTLPALRAAKVRLATAAYERNGAAAAGREGEELSKSAGG